MYINTLYVYIDKLQSYIAFWKNWWFLWPNLFSFEFLITIMYIRLRFDEILLKSQFNVHLHALIERWLFLSVGEGFI